MLYLMLFPFVLLALVVKLIHKKWKPARELRGKHVCVIGGSSGIGRSVAVLAAKRGAHVTIVARNQNRLDDVLAELKQLKGPNEQIFRSISIECSDFESVERELSNLDAIMPIYMLVNCAGMAICGTFDEIQIADIKKLVDVNLYATVMPLKVVLPRMKQRNNGIIVMTGSQASLAGIYGLSIYSSTKFALRGLAEALHMELINYDISITLALPPDTDTPGFENENKSKPEETKLISDSAGLFQPDDVAKKLLKDALEGNFFSTVGFESFILTTLTVGMSPFTYVFDVLAQTLLMGLIRLSSIYYLSHFYSIIRKGRTSYKTD